MPPEITSLMPSSIDMSRWTRSLRGTNSRKPEVGFGVVGRKTLTSSSPVGDWHLVLGRAGDEADRADAAARVLDQHDLAKRARGLRQHGLEDLLERAVDAAHDRHARQQVLADANQRASGEARRQEADQGQEDEHDQQAQARHAERQIGFRIVRRRQQAADLAVEVADELPDQERRDADRRGDDHAGQEIGAQSPSRLGRAGGFATTEAASTLWQPPAPPFILFGDIDGLIVKRKSTAGQATAGRLPDRGKQ